jgi:type I restriction enzyme M protein
MVPTDEIASPANDFNLNIPRYIDSSEPEDLHDLDAHLNGGIPNRDIDALGTYWEVFPPLREALFRDNGRERYSEACVETRQVKATILDHAEFKTYAERVAAVFDTWRQAHRPRL